MARERIIDIRHPEPTDEVRSELSRQLPGPVASPAGGPRPVPDRPAVEGVLRVLRNGGRWEAHPAWYASPATCRRRPSEWELEGTPEGIDVIESEDAGAPPRPERLILDRG